MLDVLNRWSVIAAALPRRRQVVGVIISNNIAGVLRAKHAGGSFISRRWKLHIGIISQVCLSLVIMTPGLRVYERRQVGVCMCTRVSVCEFSWDLRNRISRRVVPREVRYAFPIIYYLWPRVSEIQTGVKNDKPHWIRSLWTSIFSWLSEWFAKLISTTDIIRSSFWMKQSSTTVQTVSWDLTCYSLLCSLVESVCNFVSYFFSTFFRSEVNGPRFSVMTIKKQMKTNQVWNWFPWKLLAHQIQTLFFSTHTNATKS